MASLKNLVKNSGRKIKDKCKNLNDRFDFKGATIAFMTVSGPFALYLGLEEAFVKDYLNTLSKIYGFGATSAILTHYANDYYRSYQKFREITEWAKQKKK